MTKNPATAIFELNIDCKKSRLSVFDNTDAWTKKIFKTNINLIKSKLLYFASVSFIDKDQSLPELFGSVDV